MHQMPEHFDPSREARNVIPMLKRLFKSDCHIFEHDGHCILFDVGSGNFFEIDQVQKDLTEACSSRTLNEVLDLLQFRHTEKQVLSAFRALLDAGIISDMPHENDLSYALPDRLEIVHLDLAVTTDTLSGDASDVAYMDEKVALAAVALLLKESGRIRQCAIAFRGGEPLLNAPLVEKVISEASELANQLGKQMKFRVVTDIRLLNPSLFNRLHRKGVEIVVKFAAEETLFKGQGPYSLSARGIQAHIQNKCAPIELFYVLSPQRGKFGRDMLQISDQYPTAKRLAFAPDEPGSDPDEVTDLAKAYGEVAHFVERESLVGQPAWMDGIEEHMYQVFNQKASYVHCGVGVRSLTVNPDGTLYASLSNTFCMGNVIGGIDRSRQKEWIQSTQVDKISACKSCWARNLCGGVCHLDGKAETVDISNRCRLMRHKYELAMQTCLNIATRDPNGLYRRYGEQVGG
jgi:uncharacterized protein